MTTYKTIIGRSYSTKKTTIGNSFTTHVTVINIDVAGGAALSGTIACTATFASVLKVRKLLSGVIASDSTWSGVLKTHAQLVGVIASDSTWTGTLSTGGVAPAQLVGDIPVTVTFESSLTAKAVLIGEIASDVVFASVLKTKSQLTGEIASDTTFAGTLKTKAQLVGQIASDVTFESTLKTKAKLVGDIPCDVTFAGTLGIAGGGYDADAEAFFDAAGITDTGQKDKANTLIVAWKAAGLWTKTYALWLWKTGTTAAQHSYNVKDPAVHQITWAGSTPPSHDGNGTDFTGAGYGNTGVIPSTHLALNSGGAGHYTTKDGGNPAAIIWGAYPTSGSGFMYFDRYDSSLYQLDINTNNHLAGSQMGNTVLGLHSANRTSSTHMNLYRDGALHAESNSVSSVSLPNVSIYIGALNNEGSPSHYSNEPVQIFFIKSEFWSATEEADADAAIADYIS